MPTCSPVRLGDSILISRENNFRKNLAFLNTLWLSLPNAPLHPRIRLSNYYIKFAFSLAQVTRATIPKVSSYSIDKFEANELLLSSFSASHESTLNVLGADPRLTITFPESLNLLEANDVALQPYVCMVTIYCFQSIPVNRIPVQPC